LHIIGTLGRNVVPALAKELDEDISATEAWQLLKKRTQQDSIFAKLNSNHAQLSRHPIGYLTIPGTVGMLANHNIHTVLLSMCLPWQMHRPLIILSNCIQFSKHFFSGYYNIACAMFLVNVKIISHPCYVIFKPYSYSVFLYIRLIYI